MCRSCLRIDSILSWCQIVKPDVTMDVIYTNSWHDPIVEAQVAQTLTDGDAVMGQHWTPPLPTTAAANGVFQVGYNADMIPEPLLHRLYQREAIGAFTLFSQLKVYLKAKTFPPTGVRDYPRVLFT